jgi:transposase
LGTHIHSLHAKKQHFTLDDLHQYARNECDFIGCRSKLYNIIKAMGYKFKKINNRQVLIEQPHIVFKRIKFLRQYLQYLESDKYIFAYLDETWVYENGSQLRQRVNESDPLGVPQRLEGKVKRFTILHAGTSGGFLPNCDLLLSSEIDHKDYHKNMNAALFTDWVSKQLLPALNTLPKPAVVIMDNAPYHSHQTEKAPVFSTKKGEMIEWLNKNHLIYPAEATKKVLWDIIKSKKENMQKSYVIDHLIKDNGHRVLRFPPYNCQYNPIELVWGFLKTFYNKHVTVELP